jgi:hypothetical protein
VTDHENSAPVGHETGLEQLQRIGIQVVRGLVQDKHVRRLRKEFREQKSAALSAGQAPDGLASRLGGKKEVLEIAVDVSSVAPDGDLLVASRDGFRDGRRGVELISVLIEVSDLQTGPVLHGALLGLQFPDQEVEQRRLTATIGADDADLVAAMDGRTEVSNDVVQRGVDGPLAEGHPLRFHDLGR